MGLFNTKVFILDRSVTFLFLVDSFLMLPTAGIVIPVYVGESNFKCSLKAWIIFTTESAMSQGTASLSANTSQSPFVTPDGIWNKAIPRLKNWALLLPSFTEWDYDVTNLNYLLRRFPLARWTFLQQLHQCIWWESQHDRSIWTVLLHVLHLILLQQGWRVFYFERPLPYMKQWEVQANEHQRSVIPFNFTMFSFFFFLQ